MQHKMNSIFLKNVFVFSMFLTVKSALENDVENPSKLECKYSCNNFIKLSLDNITISAVKRLKVKTKYTYADSDINISILSRKKSWVVVEKNFGDKPTSYGTKHLLPSKEETMRWFKNKKCKIGTVCPPNGNCWGSASIVCYSDETHDWVDRREFQFKGLQWSTSFHDACALDWECNYFEKKVSLHYDSDGKRFIIIVDDKMMIRSQEPKQLYSFKNYAVYIDKMPKEYEITRIMTCFKHKLDLLCEEESGAFVMFERGAKCTVLGNRKYCLLDCEFNRVRDFGANKYASVSDLNQIRDAFIVNQERYNYNMYLTDLKLRKISNFILDLIGYIN